MLSVVQLTIQEDAVLEVRLPAQGGTLVLENPDGGYPKDGSTVLVITRNGVPFSKWEVEAWAHQHKRQHGRPGALVAPNLVEGQYEVCHVLAQDYALYLGGLRSASQCRGGSLSAFGELTLTVPKAPSRRP